MDMTTVFPLFLLFSLLPSSLAEIKTLSSDSRPRVFLEKFSFTPRGYVDISVSDIDFTSSLADPDLSLFGFFLISDENLQTLYFSQLQNPNHCVLSSPYTRLLFTFRDLSPPCLNPYNRSFPVSLPDVSLFFANCAPNSEVSMTVNTEAYDARPYGSGYCLPIGRSPLRSLQFFFQTIFQVFFAIWAYLVYIKNRLRAHRYHVLMALLLLHKALNILFLLAPKEQHRSGGINPLYIYLSMGMAFFAMIPLLRLYWLRVKPFLQDREQKVILVVVPLQVAALGASFVISMIDETTPFDRDWVSVLLLIDCACFCVAIPPLLRAYSRMLS